MASAKIRARSVMAGLPLMFEPNEGQGNLDAADPRVRFVARGSGYSLFLGKHGAILNLKTRRSDSNSAGRIESLQMKLAGANTDVAVSGANLLPGKSNYLLGNDQSRWKRGIPQFAQVRYENVYPGVNLVFYGNQGRIEYDFQVAPGANPKQAELEFDGAKQLTVKDGALVVTGENGSVRFEAPRVYQEIAGRQQAVEGGFVLRGANRAGFSIGTYDHSRELVIDPILVFSSYFGGAGNETNNYVAVDQAFNIYLAGTTDSTGLATTGVFQGALGGTQNVYIAKIMPGNISQAPTLAYVTYLGGNGIDIPVGIGVDGTEDPYVAGTTTSTNFPHTLNAYQAAPASAGTHIFVTRLQSTASTLLYSSYLSGSGTDLATGMTIDQQGYLYVTGTTTSTNPQDYVSNVEWPVVSIPYGQPFQNIPHAAAGVVQFFVSKINTVASGNSSIAYSTYFGGGTYNASSTSPAIGGGIAVDSTGDIYFTGTTTFQYLGQNGTSLTDFPILNAYQPCLDTTPTTVIINPPTCSSTTDAAPDAFVAKLNPNPPGGAGGPSELVWSTYLGGMNNDSSIGVALDTGAANVFVTGTTNSPDIAASILLSTATTAYQRCLNTAMNPTVGMLCPTQPATPNSDAYIAKFTNLAATNSTTANLQLTYFSYLGGAMDEAGLAVAVNASEGAVMTGWTQSTDFPRSNTQDIQGASGGGQDAFIASLNTAATAQNLAGSWSGYFGGSGTDVGNGVVLDANQNIYFAGDTNSTDLQVKNPLQLNNAGGYDAFVTEIGTACSLNVSGVLTLGTNQTYISAGTPATFTYTITNSGSDTCNTVTFTNDLQDTGLAGVTFGSATASSGVCSSAGSTSTSASCVIQSLISAATATVTVVITPLATSTGNSQTFTGGTVSVTSSNNITPVQTTVPAQMSDYSLSISPSSATVTAGNPATYDLLVTPHPVYTTSVALSCAGVPAGASCVFSPTSVTLNGSETPTLSISTTARPIITPASILLMGHFYAMLVMVPILGWLALGSGNRRKRHVAGVLMLCAVFFSLMMLPACSHTTTQPPVSGTPAGSYTITVTAAAGSDTKSTSVVLNVN